MSRLRALSWAGPRQDAAPGNRQAGAAPANRSGRILTVHTRLPDDIEPDGLLAADGTSEMHEHNGCWSVYGGRAVEVRVEGGTTVEVRESGESIELDGARCDRFDRVRRWAADVFATADHPRRTPGQRGSGSVPATSAPRLYGGYSFGPLHRALGPWEGFPAARFVLPEWEVRHDGARTRLLVHRDTKGQLPASGVLREHMEDLAGRIRGTRGAGMVVPASARRRRPGAAPDAGPDVAPDGWRRAVQDALRRIAEGRLEKMVLARTLEVEDAANAESVFAILRAREHGTTHFFLRFPGGAVFLGASPEILVALRGQRVRTTAVAGSASRGSTREQDAANAHALLASRKDRREQEIVTEEIQAALAPLTGPISARGPHILRLEAIQHLETRMEARARPGVHVLDLLARVHPTPAVCGRPRADALSLLRRLEPFERGWYAGPIGWFDAHGDGQFAPALRCAVRGNGRWRLFAGAGIVSGSTPEREWAETRLKLEPVLGALERA